ncbi:hypothetical protein D1AOALGA4SA_9552 [Olavius algarvensis Delta 1 endosymbiont]|nr:hypothetical protein D1AOALGA4SA_9552 [Olavius algarvensis Delta 1 endosymbiont]
MESLQASPSATTRQAALSIIMNRSTQKLMTGSVAVPDEPQRIAAKAPRHKEKMFIIIEFFVS